MALIQWLFLIPLIISTLMVMSASSPIYMWVGLEINSILFIPMIISSSKPESIRSAMKYFFIQAFASLIFLIGPILMITPFLPFLLTALMIKLGAAPFHNWFPSVMSKMSWPTTFILSTWQKVGPLFLLMENIYSPFVMIMAASINALVGGLGGLAQSEIRPLLAFSSIGHMGWLLYSMNFSHLLTFVYFLSYFVHLLVLMFLFSKINTFSATDMSSTYPNSSLTKFMIPLMLMSLGGLPPLLGFIPKLLVINLATGTFIAPLILILGSYMNIYYYLNLLWNSYMSNYETFSPTTSNTFMPNALTFILLAIPLMMLYGLNMHL